MPYFSLDDRLELAVGCRGCQRSAGIRRCTDMQARLGRNGWPLGQSIGKGLHKDEKRAQQQLGGQWSKFPASSKAECIPQESIGGTPSYVSLQTCLQMNQWAR